MPTFFSGKPLFLTNSGPDCEISASVAFPVLLKTCRQLFPLTAVQVKPHVVAMLRSREREITLEVFTLAHALRCRFPLQELN